MNADRLSADALVQGDGRRGVFSQIHLRDFWLAMSEVDASVVEQCLCVGGIGKNRMSAFPPGLLTPTRLDRGYGVEPVAIV